MANVMRSVAVTAGVTNPNLLSGSAFEYPQVPTQISLGVSASATGSFITIYAGARLIVEEFTPFVGTTYPLIQDTMYFNYVALPQERLVVAARNPTGGTITFWLAMELQTVGR